MVGKNKFIYFCYFFYLIAYFHKHKFLFYYNKMKIKTYNFDLINYYNNCLNLFLLNNCLLNDNYIYMNILKKVIQNIYYFFQQIFIHYLTSLVI